MIMALGITVAVPAKRGVVSNRQGSNLWTGTAPFAMLIPMIVQKDIHGILRPKIVGSCSIRL